MERRDVAVYTRLQTEAEASALCGRHSSPDRLFAYGIAVGAAMTKHPQPYITRVAALALVSQPLYAVALGHTNSAMYAVPFAQPAQVHGLCKQDARRKKGRCR